MVLSRNFNLALTYRLHNWRMPQWGAVGREMMAQSSEEIVDCVDKKRV